MIPEGYVPGPGSSCEFKVEGQYILDDPLRIGRSTKAFITRVYPWPRDWNRGLEKFRHDRIGSHTMIVRPWYRMKGSAWGSAVMISVVLQACAVVPPHSVEQKPHPVVDQSAKLRDLRKQLREREKRIEELEAQLEALKVIDQDYKNQKPLLRPPTTLPPLE
jgi:hypothetical protein